MNGRPGRLGLRLGLLALTGLAIGAAGLSTYPLDGYEYTGIRRLRAYAMMQDGRMPGNVRLVAGARMGRDDVRLRLRGVADDLDIPPGATADPQLQAGIDRIVGRRHPSYRVAVLDITDPLAPRYAAIRPDEGYIPGSVGKLLVMTGLFNELRERYPNDIAARERVLRNTMVTADAFAMPNSHSVPVVADDWSGVTHRPIRIGDTFSLWEWVDHMVSPSSNAAGSMVWKEVLLMDAFGPQYPVSRETTEAFLRDTPRNELTERSVRILEEPLELAGLDPTKLHIRTYFTRGASSVIPGRSSFATPRALVRWLVRLEQGRLVDEWSSLEMKRLMYFTRRRYRYAASPALANAAVYFKSGSLYRCVEEAGYECGQYRGNAENLMHSLAIVESPAAAEHPRVYLISMMSNVLRVNSAEEHLAIGTEIEALIANLHPERSGR